MKRVTSPTPAVSLEEDADPFGTRRHSLRNVARSVSIFAIVGTAIFRMGNIFEVDVFERPHFQRVRDSLLSRAKSASECAGCWARNLCMGCVARCYHETGSPDFAAGANCDQIRRSVERILAKLAEIHESPERWQRFLKNFRLQALGGKAEAPC